LDLSLSRGIQAILLCAGVVDLSSRAVNQKAILNGKK
jgi:hypothetical protein